MRKWNQHMPHDRKVIEINAVDKIKIARVVKRAKCGEQKAFVELYEETYQDIYQFICSIVKDISATDDVLQETYISAFKSLSTLKDNGAFFSWLCTIAYHGATKCYKKMRSKIDNEYDSFETMDIEDDAQTPEDLLIEEEQTKLVQEAIEKLPEDQRVCVVLYYYTEVSVKDIAKIVGCSENTVKSRLRLARDKLKIIIEERSGK